MFNYERLESAYLRNIFTNIESITVYKNVIIISEFSFFLNQALIINKRFKGKRERESVSGENSYFF